MKFRVNHGFYRSITGEAPDEGWDVLPPANAAEEASGDGIRVQYAGFDGTPGTGFPKFTLAYDDEEYAEPELAMTTARARLEAVYKAAGAWA